MRRARSDGWVVIGRPTVAEPDTGRRVSAQVEGESLWFECDEVSLAPAPEAWVSALLIPSLHRRRRLVSEAPLSARWLENVERLLGVLAKRWGLPRLMPEGPVDERRAPAERRRTGLCFSGGVDSFYNVLVPPRPVDDLVYVQGFNFPLEDRPRRLAAEHRLRAVASATGREAVSVRTNLQAHPAFGKRGGVKGPGMATRLAAIGHVLGRRLDTLLVSAGWPYWVDRPHGVHWDVVPLLSSERVAMIHAGGELWRGDKLRAIAGHPLVEQHLNVCVRGAGGANCGHCDKCLRTMLVLLQAGRLAGYPVFHNGGLPLAERLRRLPSTNRGPVFETRLRDGLPPDIQREASRLVRRGRRRARWRPVYRAGAEMRRRARLARGRARRWIRHRVRRLRNAAVRGGRRVRDRAWKLVGLLSG